MGFLNTGRSTLMLLFCAVVFAFVQCAPVIEQLSSCTDEVDSVDQAKISFSIPTNVNTKTFDLYAVNSECYRCSKTLVATGLANGDASCASMWTPHLWHLYLVDTSLPGNVDSNVVSSRSYTFGDNGEYSVYMEPATFSITVDETKEPRDALMPLWVLLGVIVAVVIIAFGGPMLVEQIQSEPPTSSANNSITTTNMPDGLQYTSVPLIDDGANHENDKEIWPHSPEETPSTPTEPQPPKKKERLQSLDTFRGFSLCIMIFVNYGGGGYYFFEHAEWNGLTVADLLFPWFMWIMGVSMAMSFASILKNQYKVDSSTSDRVPPPSMLLGVERAIWWRVCKRSATLFLIGMFLANGYEYQTWRIPGVLQYFAVSYFATAATILVSYSRTQKCLQEIITQDNVGRHRSLSADAGDGDAPLFTALCGRSSLTTALWAYRYEWLIQAAILLVYLSIVLGAKVPGCPRGYLGPGGISENSAHPDCTGAIHRYIDIQVFTYQLLYHHPTCLDLYQCQGYDPEGLLGSLSACTLTYLGLMAGRVVLHYKTHQERLQWWLSGGCVLLFIAGVLCGFSKEDGVIPVNKNLWSTSFVFISAGGGMVVLSLCYVLIDQYKLWTGAPFRYLGMNSILIYCGHDILATFFPFSYQIYHENHGTLLQMNVLGTFAWVIIATYFYRIKFFVKI